jgi:hypothetical protein
MIAATEQLPITIPMGLTKSPVKAVTARASLRLIPAHNVALGQRCLTMTAIALPALLRLTFAKKAQFITPAANVKLRSASLT